MDNLLKYFGVVAGAVAGVVALFSFMGFLITLSFIDQLKLYGIPRFPEEFFKEAGIKFLRDFVDHLGEHWHLVAFLLMFIGFLCLALISGYRVKQASTSAESAESEVKNSENRASDNQSITSEKLGATSRPIRPNRPNLIRDHLGKFGLMILELVLMGLVIYLTATDKELRFLNKERQIYLVSMPAMFALATYLGVYVNELTRPTEWQRNAYVVFLILCLILAVAIPFSYGRYIYDFTAYYVTGFEYHANYESELFKGLREAINASGGTNRIYLVMGHTSGKEIFFRTDEWPWQMVLIDSNAVKLLRVTQGPPLRTILSRVELGTGELGGLNLSDEDKKDWSSLAK